MRGVAPLGVVALTVGSLLPAGALGAQSLRGSPTSLDIQNRVAVQHDFTYTSTGNQVRRFVDAGYLVPVRGNRDFGLHMVSFPYARPEAVLFIERLARQYRSACGEKLVVTSLTRPQNRQPMNASSRSVHPTGMAIDLRRSSSPACRSWLESVLLSLERNGVLEATREQRPPHYHVALFPEPYVRYVEQITADKVDVPARVASLDIVRYQVRPGDSLWTIAQRHGTTVERLKSRNALGSSRIYAGQVIEVPVED